MRVSLNAFRVAAFLEARAAVAVAAQKQMPIKDADSALGRDMESSERSGMNFGSLRFRGKGARP